MSSYHARMVEVAVRCYPQEWRDRHRDEAVELAELLVRDGGSAVLVAWSYLRAPPANSWLRGQVAVFAQRPRW
jgi:hypothetical protein